MYDKIILTLSIVLFSFNVINCKLLNCADDVDDVVCAENEIKNFVDQIDKRGKVNLLGDYIVIERTGDETLSRTNQNLDEIIANFITNHALKFKLPTDEDSVIKVFEEARSSKLKKIILPLILLLKLKAAIIIPAVLSAIALIAFKGLGASIVAITLAGATALKSLFDHHHHISPKVTYEVVPQIASHWSRSSMDGIESYPIPGYHTIA